MQDLLGQARTQLRHEPIERRVRAALGGATVVDSTRALLVWEPRRVVPSYAVPEGDIDSMLPRSPGGGAAVAGVLHPGIPFAVHTADGEPVAVAGRAGAGFRLADPDLAGFVALDFHAFDAWHEEADPVLGHPREPFHRVEVRRTDRRVRIELDGEVVADSTRARLVYETSLPMRFYLPREDLRVALQPSATRTYCPYKGEASYFAFELAGERREDLLWSYASPLPDVAEVAGLVACWDDRFDVLLGGERRARPGDAVSAALRDEFGVGAR